MAKFLGRPLGRDVLSAQILRAAFGDPQDDRLRRSIRTGDLALAPLAQVACSFEMRGAGHERKPQVTRG